MLPSNVPLDVASEAIERLLPPACTDLQLAEYVVAALINGVITRDSVGGVLPAFSPHRPIRWNADRVAELEGILAAAGHRSHPSLLAFCVVFISRFGAADQHRFIERALQDKALRSRAVALAMHAGFPHAAALAAEALEEKSTVVLRMTIRAVVEADPAMLPALAPKILKHARSRNRAVRAQVAQACALLQTGEALPVLEQLFTDPEPTVRVSALRGLVMLSADAASYVSVALRDPSAWLRNEGAKLAYEFHVAVGTQEIEALLRDESSSVRRDGLKLLYQVDPALATSLVHTVELSPMMMDQIFSELGIVVQSSGAESPSSPVSFESHPTRNLDTRESRREFYTRCFEATISEDFGSTAAPRLSPDLLNESVAFVFLGRLVAAALHGYSRAIDESDGLRQELLQARKDRKTSPLLGRGKSLLQAMQRFDEKRARNALEGALEMAPP